MSYDPRPLVLLYNQLPRYKSHAHRLMFLIIEDNAVYIVEDIGPV